MNELERCKRRVGTTLRRKYTIDALLGLGAAGSVYSATHRNGTRVALKIMHPELAQRPDMRARFLRECYVANKIKHPGVVPILDDDDDDDDDTVFLVMALLDGETLDAKWERTGKALPLPLALSFVDAVLDVLSAAHAEGIVHRDVKPDNVFVTRTGGVKVLDFGLARVVDGGTTTHSGSVFGTPAFMSPEQAAGRIHEIDPRSDVWSVGAMLFTLLSGRHVHEAGSPNEQLAYAASRAAPPIGSLLPTLPARVAEILDRALAFARDDRWPSSREMQAALRATSLYSVLPQEPSPPSLVTPASKR
ncbi:MAG: serine/threonine protein kinase [Deltaproteobacteria bacterium]|nr:serine/threonine protein kinase [Deltaproteobacteria bacterium]